MRKAVDAAMPATVPAARGRSAPFECVSGLPIQFKLKGGVGKMARLDRWAGGMIGIKIVELNLCD